MTDRGWESIEVEKYMHLQRWWKKSSDRYSIGIVDFDLDRTQKAAIWESRSGFSPIYCGWLEVVLNRSGILRTDKTSIALLKPLFLSRHTQSRFCHTCQDWPDSAQPMKINLTGVSQKHLFRPESRSKTFFQLSRLISRIPRIRKVGWYCSRQRERRGWVNSSSSHHLSSLSSGLILTGPFHWTDFLTCFCMLLFVI